MEPTISMPCHPISMPAGWRQPGLLPHPPLTAWLGRNGCICCTVRGDLIKTLAKLAKRAKSTGKPYDAVLIETTGLADPAPVAQTFFADEAVQVRPSSGWDKAVGRPWQGCSNRA